MEIVDKLKKLLKGNKTDSKSLDTKEEFSKLTGEDLKQIKPIEDWCRMNFVFSKNQVYLPEKPMKFPVDIDPKYFNTDQYKGELNPLQYLVYILLLTGQKMERDRLINSLEEF